MTNYNTLTHNLKRGFVKFSEKISKNLSRPDFKLISQMIFGISTAQSCHLSKIARALNEKTNLKKVIDRLSHNLNEFEHSETLSQNYINAVKPHIKDNGILIIDGSDITKPCSKVLEGICRVRDGSTGEYGDGYHTLGVVALSENRKMPISVYDRIYSSLEKDFISEDREVIDCLKLLSKNFKKSNIRAFDRGYDNNTYYEYLIKNSEKFIIRAKKNRDVIYNNERVNILELAKRYKGKYSLKFKKKSGKQIDCKVSIIPIKLPCKPSSELSLVVCYGFGNVPMMLITNLKNDDKRLSVAVTKVYLMRWRIEEFYKFKKQQFGFEDLRVRSLASIRNLNLMLTIVIGYIGIMSEKSEERATIMEIVAISKRIYGTPNFLFYAIADGLFAILHKCKQGICDMLKKKPKSNQLCFLPDIGFGLA